MKTKSEYSKPISIRLSEEISEAFEKEAEKMAIGLATYVRVYIERMIKNHGIITLEEKKYA
jgi:predicted DNA-binding protein